MSYLGRISIVLIYITIVIGWHSFYFLVDFETAYHFMIVHGNYKWDLIFIPLLSPLFWWLGFQYDKAKFLSEKDALTGLFNRRFISKRIPKLFAKVNRLQKQLTLSIIDCNNFKQINDTLGHETGDMVLKRISEILNAVCKKDIVARWGGDEFLIVSPNSNVQAANEISKELSMELAKLSEEIGIDISVSFGIAVYPNDALEISDLLKLADKNMYECKMQSKSLLSIMKESVT